MLRRLYLPTSSGDDGFNCRRCQSIKSCIIQTCRRVNYKPNPDDGILNGLTRPHIPYIKEGVGNCLFPALRQA